MYKNYFFLNKEIVELNKEYLGFSIVSIFSQYKNNLLIECLKKEEKVFIEISTNPGNPYLQIRKHFSRAKRNTINIFSVLNRSNILSFEIAEDDRIIRIVTEEYSLYFPIRGKYTNVYLIKNNIIQSYKKSGDEIALSFEKEIANIEFINNFRSTNFIEDYDKRDIQLLRNEYPTISKDIILEYNFRTKNGSPNLDACLLKTIIDEIKCGKITCYLEPNNYQIKLTVNSFVSIPQTEKKEFDDYQEALTFLLSKRKYYTNFSKSHKIIDKYLSKELEFISSKLNNLKVVLERGEQSQKYKNIADLLLISINSIKKGMSKIILNDFSDKEIEIKLDEKVSSKKNINNYYSKARGEKIRFENAKKDFEISNKRLFLLRNVENKFKTITELSELEKIIVELKLNKEKKQNTKETMTSKFRTYLIDEKFYVYVGKDGKTNDMLTTKFAKQNDVWFHVRGLPGSHVILRIIDTKTKPPKSIIKIAATVAAFHSKAKTAGLVPVSYAQKKYVIKKKGMAPGKVLMLKEETVLVRPQIPKNCVFVSSVL